MVSRSVEANSDSANNHSVNQFRLLIKGDLDRGFGAGGEWKYTDIKHKLAFDVRYQQQYGVQLRTSGQVLIFSITFLNMLPPPKPAK